MADWSRSKASDLVSNWLSAGIQPDVIFANNDEMAIGAAQALKAAGVPPEEVVVAGIDATPDALMALKSGDVDLTVFQDAAGQGRKGARAPRSSRPSPAARSCPSRPSTFRSSW